MGAIGTVGSYFMLQSMGDVVNGVDMSAVKAMATPLTLLQGLFFFPVDACMRNLWIEWKIL